MAQSYTPLMAAPAGPLLVLELSRVSTACISQMPTPAGQREAPPSYTRSTAESIGILRIMVLTMASTASISPTPIPAGSRDRVV